MKKHKGQYSEKSAALTPWYNCVDMRFLQDFFIQTGSTRHFAISLYMINLPNLLSKNWGIRDLTTVNNPLSFKGIDASGTPAYTLAELNKQLVTTPFQNNVSITSTWGMQLGLRYIF